MTNKLICMGECLVDFLPAEGGFCFEAKAGGAPANVCACAARLGADAYYMGSLSEDMFGQFLRKELKKYGVKLDYATATDRPTALAFVSLGASGEREFSFYRENTADLAFPPEEVGDVFKRGDILHFCSVALTESETKRAHERAIDLARRAGCSVSFDVNIRLRLWKDEEKCNRTVREFLKYADIVKVSSEEAVFLTGRTDLREAAAELKSMAENAKLVFLTKGADGAAVFDRENNFAESAAFPSEVKDTTGAGDCFIGCVLFKALEGGEPNIRNAEKWLRFALKGAAKVVSAKGAMEAMPTLDDIGRYV